MAKPVDKVTQGDHFALFRYQIVNYAVQREGQATLKVGQRILMNEIDIIPTWNGHSLL